MTVSVIDGQLKVVLTETETVRFNIDRVFFDKSDLGAAKGLSCLLKTAAAKANFTSAATKFLIELYPVLSGGCEVWYIPDQNDRTRVKRRSLYELKSSECLMSACEMLYSDPKTRYLKSAVYCKNGKYRLEVTGLTPTDHGRLLSNFAERVLKSVERAKTVEHWQCVCPKNAIAVIGAAICHRED